MSIVNVPQVSKTIARMYGSLVVFIAACAVFFAYAGFYTPMRFTGIAASIISGLVGIIIFFILRSLYRTRYVLTGRELVIETTKLIGGGKRISLGSIISLEKILIPLGIKLFGASFHGGYYQIPVIGRAFLAITNFKDGLLIRTQSGNYIITPRDPKGFKNAVEVSMRKPNK